MILKDTSENGRHILSKEILARDNLLECVNNLSLIKLGWDVSFSISCLTSGYWNILFQFSIQLNQCAEIFIYTMWEDHPLQLDFFYQINTSNNVLERKPPLFVYLKESKWIT